MKKASLLRNISDHAFWHVSYRHRGILIPVLIILIMLCSIVLVQSYVSMQGKLKELSSYEPIYLLASKKHLNVGDIIQREDLYAKLYYKMEFDKVKTKEDDEAMAQHALVPCSYENGQLSGIDAYIGRVAKIPILRDSFIRRDALAVEGSLPGLVNIIKDAHSLLDVLVDQIGFNIFIKPGDFVDLYQVANDGSQLISKNIEVILVDSLALGKAPFQVQVQPGSKRNLTLAVPDKIFKKALEAQKSNGLIVTYNKYKEKAAQIKLIKRNTRKNNSGAFQQLLMIKGPDKQVLGGRARE